MLLAMTMADFLDKHAGGIGVLLIILAVIAAGAYLGGKETENEK